MKTPLAHVLSDFRRPAPRPAPPAAPCPAASAPALTALASEDRARLIDEAYARGEQAGRAAAEADLQRVLSEAEARADERLTAEHLRWRSEHADELSARLAAGIDELEARISAAVAHVLKPFLADRLCAEMLDALAETVRTLVADDRHPALRISGPEDLLAVLREKLGTVPVSIDWDAGSGADVRVAAGDTLVETDIQRWLERFAEATR